MQQRNVLLVSKRGRWELGVLLVWGVDQWFGGVVLPCPPCPGSHEPSPAQERQPSRAAASSLAHPDAASKSPPAAPPDFTPGRRRVPLELGHSGQNKEAVR